MTAAAFNKLKVGDWIRFKDEPDSREILAANRCYKLSGSSPPVEARTPENWTLVPAPRSAKAKRKHAK